MHRWLLQETRIGRGSGMRPADSAPSRPMPGKDYDNILYGGAEEDRTPDLRIANATLSQLSYRPMLQF